MHNLFGRRAQNPSVGYAHDRFEQRKKAMFKELAKEMLGRESPGIIYDPASDSISKKRGGFSFSRAERDINDFKRRNKSFTLDPREGATGDGG